MNFLSNRRQRRTNGNSLPTPGLSDDPLDTPPDDANVDGRANAINSSEYADRCRRIMVLYQDLRALGVHATFDLPRVVVIGDQSSGKSSVVEAVTGINVPRDSGTCTRCPMECTMSSGAESWSCKIEIRNEFDSTGSKTRITTHSFAVIYDKSEMELAIRRAQAAVLSPHKDPADFLNMTEAQLREFMAGDARCLKFSRNVVQINVKDPDATDLSFVDLPGLIHNAEPYLIVTVRQLVEHYIEGKKNTLVVIAMPMTDDYEKMEAVRLAKEPRADPSGNRTIGVLTKPDLLVPGSINARRTWKAVLEGGLHPTRHGYFCVRLPDDEQRASGISKANMDEFAEEFFNDTAPWNEILDRSRFGIPNLVKFTSGLLIKLIHNYLPELARKVDAELVQCKHDIDLLPHRSIEAPKTIIMLSVTAFCQDIIDMVFGNKEKHFVQYNRALYSAFKQEIIATTPDFRPTETVSECGPRVPQSATEPRSLQDVRQVIKRCITWELPKYIPFEATKILILQYTDLWSAPALKCFKGVLQNLTGKLEDLLEKHFGRYFHLKNFLMTSTFGDTDRCSAEGTAALRKILDFESDPVFTHNFDLFNTQEEHWNSRYSGYHSPEAKPHVIHTFPKLPYDSAIDGSETTWTIADEIKIMANVQAYFQVAHKRFMDYVPLAIEHELNQNFAKKIQNALIDTIFKAEQEGRVDMKRLLDEDPVIARRRASLEEKLSELEKIKGKLDEYWGMPDAISVLSFETPESILAIPPPSSYEPFSRNATPEMSL